MTEDEWEKERDRLGKQYYNSSGSTRLDWWEGFDAARQIAEREIDKIGRKANEIADSKLELAEKYSYLADKYILELKKVKNLETLEKRVKGLRKALGFYEDEKKWFMRDEVTNMQQTTAVFHVKDPSKLPTEFKSKSYQCTARLKMDQGKTARLALQEDDKLGGGE